MLSSTTAQWCLMRLDSNYNSAVILIGSSCYSCESWDTQTLKEFFMEATYEQISWSWNWSCSLRVRNQGYSVRLSFFWRCFAIDLFVIFCCNVWLFRRFKRKTMGWLMKKFGCWSFWGHWYMPEAVLLVVHYQRVIMLHFCISGLYWMSELKCKLKWKIKFSTKMEA